MLGVMHVPRGSLCCVLRVEEKEEEEDGLIEVSDGVFNIFFWFKAHVGLECMNQSIFVGGNQVTENWRREAWLKFDEGQNECSM